MSGKVRYTCPDCGGHDIGFTCSASFDEATQTFQVEDVYDGSADTWCRDCINLGDDEDDDELSITECDVIVEEVPDEPEEVTA